MAHYDGNATVSVFDGRPLPRAIAAVREEYGWATDVEEGSCDQTAGGQKFESTYPESAALVPRMSAINGPREYSYSVPQTSEQGILEKIVSDYDQTLPICRYSVIPLPRETFAVIATQIRKPDSTYGPLSPVLDTTITVPASNDPLLVLGNVLSAATGVKILVNPPMSGAVSPVRAGPALSGPARTVLKEETASVVWDLYWDAREKSYVVNLSYLRHAEYDDAGRRRPF